MAPPCCGMYSGLVHLAYSGDERALLRLPCFGNVFQVIRSYHGKGLSLEKMVQSAAGTHARIGNPGKGGFRVRFQKEGRFVAVDKAISLQAERAAQRATGLRLDRLHPQVELWYILRREGVGYYALLQQGVRRAKGEPAPGELRPELAYLLCRMANISKGDWVCDPLAGHGAIPRQLLQHFPWRTRVCQRPRSGFGPQAGRPTARSKDRLPFKPNGRPQARLHKRP